MVAHYLLPALVLAAIVALFSALALDVGRLLDEALRDDDR